jgi:hypothetical protein
MKRIRILAGALGLGAALVLVACGGGGGSPGVTGQPTQLTGTMNIAITDGPSDEFQHVWVTINAISFHTDPNASWSATDATWYTTTLPAPVTLDLTALSNGVLNNLFSGIALPPGTYRQIRFFLTSAEAGLTSSAMATKDSNGAALQWNDQVEYLIGAASAEAPLEIAYPVQGIQLVGTFVLAAGSTLNLAVDFDLEHSVVPFRHDGMTYFTMRPTLHYYDMSQAAAIVGQVNPAALCQTVAAAISQASSCAFNLIVKAELLTADGSRHFVARETTVDPKTGNFVLYPLATQDLIGNPIAYYDVLIRGREMATMLVTSVVVTPGTSPTGTGAAAPAAVQVGAVLPVPSTEYAAQFAAPLAPLTSGYAIFQQTLPGTGNVPYEVRWRNTDPFTGEFLNPIPLQDANSMFYFAPWNNGNTLNFTSVAPAEGAGAFSVAQNENAYYTLSPDAVMLPPASGTQQTFMPGTPSLVSGVQSGSVMVNLSFSGISVDNKCEFVLVRFASIVDTYDCSSMLGTNSGMNSGSFTLTGIPAGASGANVLGAYYYAYVRLWETGHGVLTRRIVPIPGFINLINTGSATVNASIVGA